MQLVFELKQKKMTPSKKNKKNEEKKIKNEKRRTMKMVNKKKVAVADNSSFEEEIKDSGES